MWFPLSIALLSWISPALVCFFSSSSSPPFLVSQRIILFFKQQISKPLHLLYPIVYIRILFLLFPRLFRTIVVSGF
ncbi:hypothetical protein R3P38DRAFT_3030320, partial [Favolaschia claudopus]